VSDIRDPHEAERLAFEEPDAYLKRREFLQRAAMTAGLGAAMGLTLDPETLVAEAATQQRRKPLPGPRNLPIDTFVIVMMENRSFDHHFGWVPHADGRQAGLSYTDPNGVSHSTYPLAPDFQGCGHPIPGHLWNQARVQFDNGKCDGFLAQGSGNDVFAIGYYREKDLTFTPQLVHEFTTCDRYFSSLLASTNPNRAYAHAAQSYGQKFLVQIPGDGAPQFPPTTPGLPANTNIEAALARKGLRATTFYSDDNYAAMWGPKNVKYSAPIAEFFERCGRGTLPQLCFVDPRLNSGAEETGTSSDGHPVSDIRTAEAFVSDAVNAFIHSAHWKRGALFYVCDEWGGFFDHVPPPSVPDARRSSDLDNDFGQMGFRVPAVVVSPYARRGAVAHTRFGHESILKMVEYRYGLKPLTTRDAKANNIGLAFNFRQKPRKAPTLKAAPHWISQACPST
jgi:phospholipase C